MSLVSSCTSATLLQPRDCQLWPCDCFGFRVVRGEDLLLASTGLAGSVGLLRMDGLPGFGLGGGLEGSSSWLALSFHHGEGCAEDIVALLCISSLGIVGGEGDLVREGPVGLFPGGRGRLALALVKDFWPPAVGGKMGGGRESRDGDGGRCGSLGAECCCCDGENTGTPGACGLRGAPRDGGRSSMRGGCVPFAPGRAGGGRESMCMLGLLDMAGVGGSGRVWMLF